MLKISKNGIIYILNEENGNWVKCESNLMEILSGQDDDFCMIEEGVTFGDVFKMIELYYDFFSETINSILDSSFDVFLDEMKKETQIKSNIKYIELAWNVEEVDGFLEEDISLSAWSPTSADMPKIIDEDGIGNIPCSISLLPVYCMRDTPIVLNVNYDIYKINPAEFNEFVEKIQDNTELINKDSPNSFDTSIFSTKKHFTLIDILETIIFEISLYGTPSQRDIFKGDIIDMVENSLSEGSTDYTEEELERIYEEQQLENINIRNNNDKKDKQNEENTEKALKELDDIFEEIDDV